MKGGKNFKLALIVVVVVLTVGASLLTSISTLQTRMVAFKVLPATELNLNNTSTRVANRSKAVRGPSKKVRGKRTNSVHIVSKVPPLNPGFSGEFAPIIKGEHPDYTGLQISALDLIRKEDINWQKIRKYIRNVLTLKDGGEARENFINICKYLNREEFIDSDKLVLESYILKLLGGEENVDTKKVSNYVKKLMRHRVTYYRTMNVCNMFGDAHIKAQKTLKLKKLNEKYKYLREQKS